MNTGHWNIGRSVEKAPAVGLFLMFAPASWNGELARAPSFGKCSQVTTTEGTDGLQKQGCIPPEHVKVVKRQKQRHGFLVLGPVFVKTLAFLCSSQLPRQPVLQRRTQPANISPDQHSPGFMQ